MNDYIKWCSCHRRILTTRQMEKNQSCEICQQDFKDKETQQKEKNEKRID